MPFIVTGKKLLFEIAEKRTGVVCGVKCTFMDSYPRFCVADAYVPQRGWNTAVMLNRNTEVTRSVGRKYAGPVSHTLLLPVAADVKIDDGCASQLMQALRRRQIKRWKANRRHNLIIVPVNQVKQPRPADFREEGSIGVPRHPDEYGFPYDVIFRNKSPEA